MTLNRTCVKGTEFFFLPPRRGCTSCLAPAATTKTETAAAKHLNAGEFRVQPARCLILQGICSITVYLQVASFRCESVDSMHVAEKAG